MTDSPLSRRVLLGAVLGFACSPPDAPPQEVAEKGPPQVVTLKATPVHWSDTIHGFGVVSSSAEVEISVPFSAKVAAVSFAEGERVEEGQVLVKFEAVTRRQRLKQSRASVNDLKGALKRARTDLEKTRTLLQSGAASAADVDTAEDSLRQTQARYDDAMASLRLAEHDVRETTLRSPVAGVVQSRSVDVGETVNAGAPIAVIQAIDTLRIETHVSEIEVNAIEIGGNATITSAGARGQTYTARVESIGISADPETGNFPVKLALADTSGLLRPGMTARIALRGAAVPDTVAVPTRAIVDRHRERVLFVVQDGKAIERTPVLGLTDGAWIPVYEGLNPGEQVILEGLAYVIDGIDVEASEVETPPPPPEQALPAEDEIAENEGDPPRDADEAESKAPKTEDKGKGTSGKKSGGNG